MFAMREPRKESKCGFRWDNASQEYIDTGKGCGQWIYIEKEQNGKWKITNSRNGRGGKVNEAHKCHNTGYHAFEPVNMRQYDYHQENKLCNECLQTFNSYITPLCPSCFKLECRECKNLQTWVAGKGMLCFQCGGKCDVRQVWNAYQRIYGKYTW